MTWREFQDMLLSEKSKVAMTTQSMLPPSMKDREYKKIRMYLIICADEKEEIHQKAKEICYRLVVE